MEQLHKGPIQPLRLGPDSRFTFRCHKDVKCFTQCCRGINIILTPYDIIRLKNRLGLSSGEFLAVYTELQMLEKTDVPGGHPQAPGRRGRPGRQESLPLRQARGLHRLRGPPHRPAAITRWGWPRSPTRTTRRAMSFSSWCARPTASDSRRTRSWTVLEWREDQGVDVHDRDQRPVDGPHRPQALVSAEHALDREDQADVLHGQLRHRQVPQVRLRKLVSQALPGGPTDLGQDATTWPCWNSG